MDLEYQKIKTGRHFDGWKLRCRDYVGNFLRTNNYRDNIWGWRLDFPLAMCVNVHTFCNQSCRMCPYHELKKVLPMGVMEWKLYQKLIDEFKSDGGQIVTFNNFSEIFAHPKGVEYVLAALNKNIDVYLVSNGTFLTKEIVSKLFDNNFRGVIYVSCHGFSDKTVKKVTGVDNFGRVKKNLEYLAKKHSRPSNIIVQYVVGEGNKHELEAARKHWQSLGISFNQISEHSFADRNYRVMDKRNISQDDRLFGCNSWGHDGGLPFYQIVIQCDGRVTLCCMDVRQEYVLGNVTDSSIKEVWNSDSFKKMIENIYTGKLKADANFICNRCPDSIYQSSLIEPKAVETAISKTVNIISKYL
ncbi:SPASM domain-containing protein [Patescibacteria group bacterium]|nr:SPASM domain-containing protein [Patescibacteria group bacterium]